MADRKIKERTNRQYIIGLFEDEDKATAAVASVAASDWNIEDVYSPVPSKKITDALGLKKSRVGYFTLAGGITGFLSGIGLAVYAATQWHLIVQGKPVVSLVPFFIVGFELTILFSVIANVIGFLFFTGLPRVKLPMHYFPECSGEVFGVVASCKYGDHGKLMDLFKRNGGEARIY